MWTKHALCPVGNRNLTGVRSLEKAVLNAGAYLYLIRAGRCDPENGLLSDATLKEVRKHMTAHMQKLKREAAKESGAAQRLREQIDENARQQENVIDLVAAHGRTAALDKRLRKLEQERKTLEAKLATTKAGKLENLPDVIGGKLLDYRAKVAALADGSHGLGAHQFAKAKALIAEILGGPVPVDPKGVARLDLARMVVAGAGFGTLQVAFNLAA